MISLLLTIASVQTQHNVSEIAYSRDLFQYVEAGVLYDCQVQPAYSYYNDGAQVKVTVQACETDRIFGDGFESPRIAPRWYVSRRTHAGYIRCA